MWITKDVNLPQELLEAAENDELVLFVGAGASINPPSNLPLYKNLTERLADEADRPGPGDDEQLDRFIGKLPKWFDTHKTTKRIIGEADSHFNEEHAAIVSLASALRTPRIVTTNYDLHLEEAAAEGEFAFNMIYNGPAVPIGNSFSGLLHLHGSLHSSDSEIILDDRDFANAYISDPWATRFLLKLFDSYFVVFIGYGFTDPIMRYLALGISSKARPRYIFLDEQTAETKHDDWIHDQLITITYPAENHHVALTAALNAWANNLHLDYEGYKQRIPDILRNGVPKDPVDLDYLSSALHTEDGSRCFVESMSDESVDEDEWIKWLIDNPRFTYLFTETESPKPYERPLIDWLVFGFAQKPDKQDVLLDILMKLQNSMSNYLFQQLCWATGSLVNEEKRKEALPAFTILMTSIGGHSAPNALSEVLGYDPTLVKNIPPRLLSQFIRPYLNLSTKMFGHQGKPNAQVVWPCSRMTLLRQERSHELLNNVSEEYAKCAESELLAASALTTAYGDKTYSFLSRPSIEEHDQNRDGDDLQSLFIDLLRDYTKQNHDKEDELIARWWETDVPLLQRIAINAVAYSNWSDDKKMQWLLSKQILFDSETHHEVYTVLQQAIGGTTSNVRQLVLNYVRDVFPKLSERYSEERTALYEQYDVLQWMMRFAGQWPEAAKWRDKLSEENDFAPREHADFLIGPVEGGIVTTGITDDRFLRLIIDEPETVKSILFTCPENYAFSEDSYVFTHSGQISRVAKTAPLAGLTLWRLLVSHTDNSYSSSYRRSVIEGWAQSSLDDTQNVVLQIIVSLVPQSDDAMAKAIADFLFWQTDREETDLSYDSFTIMDHIAGALWEHVSDTAIDSENDMWRNDPFTHSLNCTPGEIAHYWIGRIRHHYLRDKESWQGMETFEKTALRQLALAKKPVAYPVRAAILREINMLHSLDRSFIESILPDVLSQEDTSFIWKALLPYPNLSNRLLEVGFFKSCTYEFAYLQDLEESHQKQFLQFVFWLLSSADINEEQRESLLKKIVTNDDGHIVVEFMDTIVWFFEFHLSNAEKDHVWDLWLRTYIKGRSEDRRRNWSEDERLSFSKLIPFLGDHIQQGLTALEQRFPVYSPRDVAQCLHTDISKVATSANGESLIAYYCCVLQHLQAGNYPTRASSFLDALQEHYGKELCAPLESVMRQRGLIKESSDSTALVHDNAEVGKIDTEQQKEVPENAGPVPDQCRTLTSQQKLVYEYILQHQQITPSEAQHLLGVKERRARTVLGKLISLGLIQRLGSAQQTRYVITNANQDGAETHE